MRPLGQVRPDALYVYVCTEGAGRLVRKWHTIANKEKHSKEITAAIFSCENIFKLIFNVCPLSLEAPGICVTAFP